MGLFSRKKPKIKVQTTKRDGFSGWLKCSNCDELIHGNELQSNLNCCPKCQYHYRLSGPERIDLLADSGSFKEHFSSIQSTDPLSFVDSKSYKDRLSQAKTDSGRNEAALIGTCRIEEQEVVIGTLDFNFMAGSMGSVVGERITKGIELAIKQKLPFIMCSTTGGARMQESVLSLMQMAKTSAALAKLEEAKLPYISILANPTTGGVTASFASLGDIIIAEPGALICFAGPRVIEQTIGHQLPKEAQKSEFLLEHGMIDCISPRSELKSKVANFLRLLTKNSR